MVKMSLDEMKKIVKKELGSNANMIVGFGVYQKGAIQRDGSLEMFDFHSQTKKDVENHLEEQVFAGYGQCWGQLERVLMVDQILAAVLEGEKFAESDLSAKEIRKITRIYLHHELDALN